ncbi:ATP-binding protein [Streptomyces sp. NPDC015220]|uniref:ATP-binding protein n=1 Tax=Streptomyces sp. NPDC015220 TaxID=3364947 RepID=UPI0036F697FC
MNGFGDCDDLLRDTPGSAPDLVRLLPWTGAHGQPCLLLTDGDGTASRLADRIEDTQLALGERLLGRARELIGLCGSASAGDFGVLTGQLADALGDVLRIARSRGARLGGAPQEPPALTTPSGALLAYNQWSLPGGDLASAPAARRHVRDTARSWRLPSGPADDLETVAGELVANALEHSGSPRVVVACAHRPGTVTMTVTDAGGGHVSAPASFPSMESERGRGLLITDALATRWGTRRAGGGLTVWAEITTGSPDPRT